MRLSQRADYAAHAMVDNLVLEGLARIAETRENATQHPTKLTVAAGG